MFLKISDNSTENSNTFRGGYDDKFYAKIFGIYPTIDLKKNWGLFVFKRNDKKSQRYSNSKNAFRCQILVLRDYRFQFNIKILSKGAMITIFISKYLEFIQLLICKKIPGVIFI